MIYFQKVQEWHLLSLSLTKENMKHISIYTQMFIIILAVQRKDKTDRKLEKTIYEKFIVGTVLIVLCKAFKCILQKVLIAYLNARD